ncbi:MAG: SDR family oxidoreductase, partial [Geminicoccaceae bacterium]|nr:SDR family oxidoreductase [Geminicoccaceae bacterium]
MSGRLLCIGMGYTARTLATRLEARGWSVGGTSRRGESGLVAFSRERPLPAEIWTGVTHVLVSIPPDERGDVLLDLHERDLKRAERLRWVGWLGTTAVYGDTGGAWVDEESPLRPSVPRAERRASAERAWRSSGLPVHLFRLAGIYGPGRNALVNLRTGDAHRIVKPGQVFSRIHVDDIATTLEASIARPDPGRVYNVCDDEPAPPQDVVSYAADLLGIAPPVEQPFETADLSPMA